MGTFSDNMQVTASRLLTKYGRAVTFSRVVEGDYNPASSDVGAPTISSYSGYAHPQPYSSAEIATGVVTVKDVRLIIYTTTLPLTGDTCTIDASVYRVMNVERLNAQGEDIAYRLQLRI